MAVKVTEACAASMEKLTEKRSGRRTAIHQPVSFEINDRRTGRFANVLIDGQGVDMSAAGIGLITVYPLKEGEILKLLFPAAEVNIQLPVYSEVMWSTTTNGMFRAGLRFLV